VTALSTPLAPFIQTYVGLRIIFLQDRREEEPNQEEDGKELQVSQIIEVAFGERHHSPLKEVYWED